MKVYKFLPFCCVLDILPLYMWSYIRYLVLSTSLMEGWVLVYKIYANSVSVAITVVSVQTLTVAVW